MFIRLLPLLLACTALAGCATWVAPLSDNLADRDHGHRTLGARVEDAAIEYKTRLNMLRSGTDDVAARIVAVSWNGQLLLAGQVTSPEERQRAEDIARRIRHVIHVHNELELVPVILKRQRVLDSWITTQIKTRLAFTPDVPARRIKVVTENGVAYLMGLVTPDEAAQVVEAARHAWGVTKIVKIFEYIAPENAAPGRAAPDQAAAEERRPARGGGPAR